MLVSELTGEDWRGCGEQLALLSFVAVGPGVPRALAPPPGSMWGPIITVTTVLEGNRCASLYCRSL